MSILSVDMSKSINAMLSLLIDGKSVSFDDVIESLKNIKSIDNLEKLIDETYLISMYHFLTPLKDQKELDRIINLIEVQYAELDVDEFDRTISYYKFLFIKLLCGHSGLNIKKTASYASIEYLKDLDKFSVLGILFLCIGILNNDSAISAEGCNLARIVLDFINASGEIESLFLHEKGRYKKDSTRMSLYILLNFYSKLTRSGELGNKIQQLDPYQGGLFQSLEVEKRLLSRCYDKIIREAENFPAVNISRSPIQNILKIEYEGFKVVTSNSKKVGIGTVSYMDRVIIPSFGPHILPLGKNDYYGLQDKYIKEGEMKDNSIQMWNRVRSDKNYSNHWMYSDIFCREKQITIESFLWQKESNENLSLVFFCRGKSIEVEKNKYYSGGLSRVSVTTSKLFLDIEDKKMEINFTKSVNIEVIPLAGQDFFWNSDFILSIPFVDNQMLRIDFIMD